MATAAAERRLRQLKRAAEDAPAGPSVRPPKKKPAASRAAAAAEAEKGRANNTAEEERDGSETTAEPSSGGEGEEEEEESVAEEVEGMGSARQKRKARAVDKDSVDEDKECSFVGNPVADVEARERWPKRYVKKRNGGRGTITSGVTKGDEEEILLAQHHYLQAKVDDCVYCLYDNVYVKAEDGKPNFIGRIIELFETADGKLYFTSQWFYRAEDTVLKEHTLSHDKRRVFLSEDKDDNPLNCIVSKVHIVRVSPNVDLEAKEETIPLCDLYYDMSYSVAYTTFACLTPDNERATSESSSVTSSEDSSKGKGGVEVEAPSLNLKEEYSLLDLYSGCGAMSTGLCLGTNLSGLNLQTKWAVDINSHACDSLRLNHPRTEVRNEEAEDFLALLREWEQMCHKFSLTGTETSPIQDGDGNNSDDDEDINGSLDVPTGEFEVEKLVGICFGDPNNVKKKELMFKVRWKGYGPSDDTWEPAEGLSKCQERIENFVRNGYRRNILPLPGAVDVICGGPPCQGISGFNRFRKSENPLEDPKNQQMVVFMEIVEFLKPRYVLMENVADILKFAKGFLGRYALSRLVSMNYQARLGMMVAGCYGLPQFRIRVFLWGALPTEILPQFPLPTHDVVVRGGFPNEFGQSMVAYDEDQFRQLEKALHLKDAISDLPPVTNHEKEDEMLYGRPPRTDFQRFIRLSKDELMNASSGRGKMSQHRKLYDHRPLQLNDDDFERVCQIPKRKGANFRDLPGLIVGSDNVVRWDPNVPRIYLPSGKPLVPDYAMSYLNGKSTKPFGRLWWDETVPTVVTRAEPHNQIILHPEQDRVLTIRENARLQGFPDYYQLRGPVKERYIQVGNAVAVPVSRALGYAMGLAIQRKCSSDPLFSLPVKFPRHGHLNEAPEVAESVEVAED